MTGSTRMETGDLQVREGLPVPLLAGQAGRALRADNRAPVSTVIAAVLTFLGEGCWRSGTDIPKFFLPDVKPGVDAVSLVTW